MGARVFNRGPGPLWSRLYIRVACKWVTASIVAFSVFLLTKDVPLAVNCWKKHRMTSKIDNISGEAKVNPFVIILSLKIKWLRPVSTSLHGNNAKLSHSKVTTSSFRPTIAQTVALYNQNSFILMTTWSFILWLEKTSLIYILIDGDYWHHLINIIIFFVLFFLESPSQIFYSHNLDAPVLTNRTIIRESRS